MVPEPTDHNKNWFPSKWSPGATRAGSSWSSWSRSSSSSWDRWVPLPSLPWPLATALVAAAAFTCFANSLGATFVFDDSEAVLGNADLRPDTPLWSAFTNDFWGTPLTHNSSHKSYRPLTVLSFRLNYWLSGGLHPWGFHLTNVLLHSVASALSMPVFVALLKGAPRAAFLCALLFAVHPVHTESVAGVVGRADLLCAVFLFMAFLAYSHGCRPGEAGSLCSVLVSVTLCAVSMLCKEQGITAIGLCSAYDVIVVSRLQLPELQSLLQGTPTRGRPDSPQPDRDWLRRMLLRHLVLLLAGMLMMSFRWHIMGAIPPTFQRVDNPASFASTFYERTINYNYIYSLNSWLLIHPRWLCFDWSMGCVPLLRSALDPRLLAVLVFWLAFGSLLVTALMPPASLDRRALGMALAFIVVPFLPASNLFFRVGFVIAERVLYVPVAGFCLVVVLGFRRLQIATGKARVLQVAVIALLFVFSSRSIQRSSEWRSEEILFNAGVEVCPLNAKVHYNIAKNAADFGQRQLAIAEYKEAIRLNPTYDQAMNNLANMLKDQGDLVDAEQLLETAISLRPDFAAAWMNLGIVQSSLKKVQVAETSYLTAIRHRPRYPDCYYNLGNLYLEQKRHAEAYAAWKNATILKPTHTVAWNNIIIMLDSTGDLERAEVVATEALQILPSEPSLHFNLANALGKVGRYHQSERHFLEAIRLSPANPTYHTNLGVLYHRWKRFDSAEKAYRMALRLNPVMRSATENLELLLRTVTKQQWQQHDAET